VTSAAAVNCFKKHLKTHLFRCSFTLFTPLHFVTFTPDFRPGFNCDRVLAVLFTFSALWICHFYPCSAMLPWVLAIAPCVCVWIDGWTDRAVFLECGLLSTYPTLCCKEIHMSAKIRVLPSGSLSQTPNLEHFPSVYPLLKCVIDLARRRWTLRVW